MEVEERVSLPLSYDSGVAKGCAGNLDLRTLILPFPNRGCGSGAGEKRGKEGKGTHY
jgi:hypothetical protein